MASLRPFHIIIVLTFLSVSGVTFSDDAAVMSNLLAAISPAPNHWSNSTHYCSWTHVTCDDDNNVISIKIDSLFISGQLFSGITQLSSLINLSVSGNSLSGHLPSFANMPMLEDLRLDGNNFSSVPSDFLSGLPRLKSFSVSENPNLSSWEIPMHLNRSTNLVSFNASNANVFGIIPDFFDFFPNLENVILSSNNLTGSLPGSFSGSKIRILRLDNQQLGLSGTIGVLSSMTQLSQVWLQGNAFTGQIPELYGLQNLSDLRLGDNRLTGFIPDSLRNLTGNRLRTVFLQNNKLQGPIPQFQFQFQIQVNLGNNSFCKETPGDCDPRVTALLNMAAELGFPLTLAESWTGNDPCRKWRFISCDVQGEVTTVDLENQRFSGNISRILLTCEKLTTLSKLYLNDNNFTGSIPDNLAILQLLLILDVSDNNLSGSVPDLPDSLRFHCSGNPLLRFNASNLAGKIAGIVLAVLVPVIVLVLFVSYRFYAKRLRNTSGRTAKNQTTAITGTGTGTIFPIQVLQKATNYFSEENVVGSGGYGVVYKGELDDGTKIAVKKMKDGAMRGLNEFQAEISFLAKVRHRNLVSLLGYSINESERILVYEFMPQGTLSHHLFQWQNHGFHPLTWNQRVTIALDVGRGIEYLHSFAHQSFIHRDIKPSNILLNDDMRAKVADFGLVKMVPDDKNSVETRTVGTFGYLAPEYAVTGRITAKVDVYAFGVVLMEIITGKKALDETVPNETCHLVTWFHKIISKGHNFRKAIDRTLDEDEQTFESISKVALLAAHCTAKTSYRRPNMEHVINVLGPLVQKWKPLKLEEIGERNGGHNLHLSLPLEFDDLSTQNLSSIDDEFYGYRPNQSARF